MIGYDLYSALIPIYRILDPFFLIYFSVINLIYTVLLLFGAVNIYRRIREVRLEDITRVFRSNSLPEITFILPAYNESAQIVATINNLLSLTYRYKQIIVINDGSTDDSMEKLHKEFELVKVSIDYKDKLPTKPVRAFYRSKRHPQVIVIDKDNGEKFDALNVGLNACSTYYFIVIDADTYITDLDFEALVRPIFSSYETVAMGASVRIYNGCDLSYNRISTAKFPKNFITGVQTIEYLRAFLLREGCEFLGANYIISGAFGVFITDVVIAVGGYGPTIANDLELVIRLHRVLQATGTPYEIAYYPDPVAWTDCPDSWKELDDQRMRWHRGLLETLWFHKNMFFNPKYGIQGMFVYPFLLFFEALEPIVELAGYFYVILGLLSGTVDMLFALAFLCVTFGFVFIYTLFCLIIEELSFKRYPSFKSLAQLIFYSIIEFLGYRQLSLLWRIKGFFSFYKRYGIIKRDNERINKSVDAVIKKGPIQWEM